MPSREKVLVEWLIPNQVIAIRSSQSMTTETVNAALPEIFKLVDEASSSQVHLLADLSGLQHFTIQFLIGALFRPDTRNLFSHPKLGYLLIVNSPHVLTHTILTTIENWNLMAKKKVVVHSFPDENAALAWLRSQTTID